MRDRDREHDERRREEGPRSASGTQFLDLEMSKVLYGEAEGLAREAVRDVLREALRERVRERLGTRLQALAAIAADALADEIESNLRIEEIIREQGTKSAAAEERLRAAIAGAGRSAAPAAATKRPRARR